MSAPLARIGEESLIGALALSIIQFVSESDRERHLDAQPDDAELLECETCHGDGQVGCRMECETGGYVGDTCPSCKGSGLARVYTEAVR